MKATTRIKTLLAAAIAAVGLSAWAASPESDFGFSDGTITGYRGRGGDVEIPATIGGQPVTSIGEAAFAHCYGLTSVTVLAVDPPALGAAAFSNSPVEAIYVPKASEEECRNKWSDYAGKIKGVSPAGEGTYALVEDGVCSILGTGAATSLPADFDRDSVTSAVVDGGVTEIGARFFKKCRKLNEVTLGKDVAAVGEKAFYLCRPLERIVAENPAVVEGLRDAVVYQTAIKPDGSLYAIPSISVPGYEEALYGANDLTDPKWQRVEAGKTMEESGYRFFKHVLEKVAE